MSLSCLVIRETNLPLTNGSWLYDCFIGEVVYREMSLKPMLAAGGLLRLVNEIKKTHYKFL